MSAAESAILAAIMGKSFTSLFIILLLTTAATATAGEADVVDARASKSADSSYSFDVTVRHQDSGWEHYADRWEILDEKGEILATRVLLHPHVNEQPFTRSLSSVRITSGIKIVRIRAHDLRHEYGGKIFTLELP